MLTSIKEVLISQKQKELEKKEQVEQKINQLNQEEKEESFTLIDQKLSHLEQKISNLNGSFWKRIFHGKEIQNLYNEYKITAQSKMDKLNQYNETRNKLLQDLHSLTHDEAIIISDIEEIRNAHSLEELGLTKKDAIMLLKQYTTNDINEIIKNVFSEIKEHQQLETSDEISKELYRLSQPSFTAFMQAMSKTAPRELVSGLIDMDITLEDDKLEFLSELMTYISTPSITHMPTLQKIERVDDLDNYYCNKVEELIASMERYHNATSDIISQIMILTVLLSLAKEQKQEKLNQK